MLSKPLSEFVSAGYGELFFVALEWSTVYMNNKFDDMINKAVNDQTPEKIESALKPLILINVSSDLKKVFPLMTEDAPAEGYVINQQEIMTAIDASDKTDEEKSSLTSEYLGIIAALRDVFPEASNA